MLMNVVKKLTESVCINDLESVECASTVCDSEMSFREEEVMIEEVQKP
jgi:hypothetical protein